MRSNSASLFTTLAILATVCCLTSEARAQATRTWVSGVGDDANPGSRTAPCKTFAGAFTKTVAGGEIDVIDPGGFGAITITHSVTIDGKGPLSSILASGTPCINVAAGATDVVTLRNLSLTGAGSGTYGVRIVSGGTVRVENCDIYGLTSHAIDFEPSGTNSRLIVLDSHLHNCLGTGVYANPATGGTVAVQNTVIESCGAGVSAAGGTVTLGASTITGNTGAGLSTSGGGAIRTFHNNEIFGNNPDGNATGSLPLR